MNNAYVIKCASGKFVAWKGAYLYGHMFEIDNVFLAQFFHSVREAENLIRSEQLSQAKLCKLTVIITEEKDE